MGHIVLGFRKNEQGVIVSKQFDSDVLFGEARLQGWYDSPTKIPGGEKILADQAARAEATAHTTGQRELGIHPIYAQEVDQPRTRKGRFK